MKKLLSFLFCLLIIATPALAKPKTEATKSIDESITLTMADGQRRVVSNFFGSMFIFSNNEIVSKPVDGSLFIFGNNVSVEAKVNGNIFAFGNNVALTEKAESTSSAFTFGDTIKIAGKITQDIYAFGNDVSIMKNSPRDVFTFGNILTIDNISSRNLCSFGDTISYNAKTTGNVHLEGKNVSITNNSIIGGKLESPVKNGKYGSYQEITLKEKNMSNWTNKIIGIAFGMELVSLLTMWALLTFYFKRFKKRTLDTVAPSVWKTVGIGAASLILIPIACIILFIPVVTTPIAVLALLVWIVLLLVSKIIGVITFANVLGQSEKLSKLSIHNGVWMVLIVEVVMVISGLLTALYPPLWFLCVLFPIFIFLLGFGTLFRYFFVGKDKESLAA